jgi:tetratricopeptide (TPR) repeat protein
MRFAKDGRKQPPPALQHRSRAKLALGIIIIIFLVSFSASASLASITDQNQSKAEALLQEARATLDQGSPEPTKLRQTIALLEKYKSQFPSESRFPLYLAEAYYLLADPAADVNREFVYYEKTGAYAEQVLALDPARTEAHYWHGLFLLRKAQKQGGIRAYFIVKQGIAELEKVRQNLPTYDHAGASRVLGLLYYLAPGWTPFGNLKKSIEMGQEATRLAPDFSLNRLYLANAYKKRGDRAAAIREYQAILSASTARPENQTGDIPEQARTNLRELGVTG